MLWARAKRSVTHCEIAWLLYFLKCKTPGKGTNILFVFIIISIVSGILSDGDWKTEQVLGKTDFTVHCTIQNGKNRFPLQIIYLFVFITYNQS